MGTNIILIYHAFVLINIDFEHSHICVYQCASHIYITYLSNYENVVCVFYAYWDDVITNLIMKFCIKIVNDMINFTMRKDQNI